MRLSKLQKHILKQCYILKPYGRVPRNKVEGFFKIPRVKIVTRSIERLIDKGLLVGYGMRTPEKWFISEIRLTQGGKKQARQVFGKQAKLL